MEGADHNDSDSHVQGPIVSGSKQHRLLEAVHGCPGGATVEEIAAETGWTTDEVEEVIQDMDDRGLIGDPPIETRVYVGTPDTTLAEAADELGRTVDGLAQEFMELEEKGLVSCTAISGFEYLIQLTPAGHEAADQIDLET